MNNEIKEILVERLSEMQAYHVNSENTQHMVRCPYCGDSKNPEHSHMSVKIDLSDNDAMLYYCFRCGASGVVTDDFLDDIGVIVTPDEVKELRNYNKRMEKLAKKRTIIKTERFVAPLCQPNLSNDSKLAYLNGRLGLQLTYEDMQANKIVPSILEFMVRNEIKRLENMPDWKLDRLDRDYIGFLSSNNNLLTMRSIVNTSAKEYRYQKVFINPLNQDNATFYSIPTRLDLMYTDALHVHIAEGTFDIVSIKYNVRPQELYEGHHVFYASCGYSYVSILKHLLKNGICTHLHVHIYADNDKPDREHERFLRKSGIDAFIEHAYIHRNRAPGMKDYGVPGSQIDHKTRKIW